MGVKIVIEQESDQVYLPEYGVPTIQLGDGNTVVSDVHGEDGFHGIGFSEAEINYGVGGDHSESMAGKRVHELGVYLQILTKNPASLDVIIEQCQRAKDALIAEMA